MEPSECAHERIEEHGELVCVDCGLVTGTIFHHQDSAGGGSTYFGSAPLPLPPAADVGVNDGRTMSARQEEALTDAISNALARLFLDSDATVDRAVRTWKTISRYRNVDTSAGRRQLAYTLWKTLADDGVLRERVDFERVCGADVGSVARLEKKLRRDSDGGRLVPRSFKRASERVETLGSWLGLPFRYRRLVAGYMKTFELDNRYLSQKPEVLAAASLLFVCDRLRRRVQSGRLSNVRLRLPEYVSNITPNHVAELINVGREEVEAGYRLLAEREKKGATQCLRKPSVPQWEGGEKR